MVVGLKNIERVWCSWRHTYYYVRDFFELMVHFPFEEGGVSLLSRAHFIG